MDDSDWSNIYIRKKLCSRVGKHLDPSLVFLVHLLFAATSVVFSFLLSLDSNRSVLYTTAEKMKDSKATRKQVAT